MDDARGTIGARALAVLRARGPMRCSRLGWELWGASTAVPDRGEGSHRTNKFCRSAGKLLRALERRGLARWTAGPGGVTWEAVPPPPSLGASPGERD